MSSAPTAYSVRVWLSRPDCALGFGTTSTLFFLVNNILLVAEVVGATTLWAQSGMRARDAAVLGAALTVYDLVFTWQMPLMGDLFSQLDDLPFAPIMAWSAGEAGMWLGLGLGNLLLAAVFPLVCGRPSDG